MLNRARRLTYFLLISCLSLCAARANAGYIEIGATGNYRISRIDKDNYQEMVSYTGSISYYFWEMSALELSYTEGTQVVVLTIPGDNKNVVTTVFRLIGGDLVLTLADKDSLIQPYVKIGGAYMTKKITREIQTVGSDRLDAPGGLVPSAGVGLKLKFSPTMSIKVGLDAWTSPPEKKPVTVDYAGRAGISWMF